MTSRQIEHVEEQLVSLLDLMVEAAQKNAISSESVKTIPEIALALARLNGL